VIVPVEHSHGEGQAVPCDDELLINVHLAFPVFDNTARITVASECMNTHKCEYDVASKGAVRQH
jgi:hypothetical protein